MSGENSAKVLSIPVKPEILGFVSPKIAVGISPTLGIRGIVAVEGIMSGEILECSPVILVGREHHVLLDSSMLRYYYFEWDERYDAVPLGYAAVYNHSYQANAEYVHDHERNMLSFRACRDIAVGEEVTVNYNGEHNDETPIEDKYLSQIDDS